MARAKVWAEPIKLKGRRKPVWRWCFYVTGWNGIVLTDNGYGTQQQAFADADSLARAVDLVEGRGHQLRPWKALVDEAVI